MGYIVHDISQTRRGDLRDCLQLTVYSPHRLIPTTVNPVTPTRPIGDTELLPRETWNKMLGSWKTPGNNTWPNSCPPLGCWTSSDISGSGYSPATDRHDGGSSRANGCVCAETISLEWSVNYLRPCESGTRGNSHQTNFPSVLACSGNPPGVMHRRELPGNYPVFTMVSLSTQ